MRSPLRHHVLMMTGKAERQLQRGLAMPQKPTFFDELKEWSNRKIDLIEHYLAGASKILGKSCVYYVDGFAGRGSYRDGAKGSPVRIAELAEQCERDDRKYSLRCINIEEDKDNFANLDSATAPFRDLVTNIQGRFGDNADNILRLIGDRPIIAFLDPFGVKGIPWRVIQKLVARRSPTDLWIRFDDIMVQRLDGFYGKTSSDAAGKYQLLAETYGIEDKALLHGLLHTLSGPDSPPAALILYMERLRDEIGRARGRNGYAAAYRVRSLSEEHKYYLVFATAHEKGITLASATVHSVEQDYQRDLQEYKESQGRQLSLFDPDPTPDEVASAKVRGLSETIWADCRGLHLSRLTIYARQMPRWFGRISGSHLTQALKVLIDTKRTTLVSGTVSQDAAMFQFKA